MRELAFFKQSSSVATSYVAKVKQEQRRNGCSVDSSAANIDIYIYIFMYWLSKFFLCCCYTETLRVIVSIQNDISMITATDMPRILSLIYSQSAEATVVPKVIQG